jgi:DNA-binding Lrp family transcriptional regulator
MGRNGDSIEVDTIDQEILQLLMRDGRLSNRALAEAVCIAESTCHVRLRNLLELGLIQGFRAKVELAALGRPIQAVIYVKVRPQNRGQVVQEARRLVGTDGVLEVLLLTGPYDLLVRVAVASPSALQDFVFDELDASHAIVATETHVVTSDLTGTVMTPARATNRIIRHG